MEYFRPDFIRPHSTRLSSAAPKDRVAKPGIVASFGEVSSVPGKQVMQGQPTIQEGAAEGGQAAGGGGSTADMGLEEFEELTGGDDGEEEEHVEVSVRPSQLHWSHAFICSHGQLSRTAEEDKEAEEARKRAKAIRTRERGMAGLRQLEKAAEPSQPAAPQPSSSQAGAPDMSLLMQQMKSMFSEQMNQMSRMVDVSCIVRLLHCEMSLSWCRTSSKNLAANCSKRLKKKSIAPSSPLGKSWSGWNVCSRALNSGSPVQRAFAFTVCCVSINVMMPVAETTKVRYISKRQVATRRYHIKLYN